MENEITSIENDARGKIRKKEEEGGGGGGEGWDLKEHTIGICHFRDMSKPTIMLVLSMSPQGAADKL